MPDHRAAAIANEFLLRAHNAGATEHMKLQKLVYIAHAWSLAIHGQPLTSDRLQAWDNGPVFPNLFRHIRHGPGFKGGLIVDESGRPERAPLTEDERALIDAVWDRYGKYSAEELSDMTHQPGTPWTEAYVKGGRNAPIRNEDVRQHYRQLAEAGRAEQR